MNEQVFAYGSNMCSGRFRAYGVSPQGQGRCAVLRSHRLQFDKKSIKDGSGKANVVAHLGTDVWGVLYAIPDDELEILDKGEGLGYRREQHRVVLADGAFADAWVYVAKKPGNDAGLRPYTWYVRFIVEGAREHALPAYYVEELERIVAVQDTDAERDRQKRALPCEAKR
jgi:gamma-glutamylcyclotransferase